MHSVASKIKFYFLNKLQNFGETFTFKNQLSLNEKKKVFEGHNVKRNRGSRPGR